MKFKKFKNTRLLLRFIQALFSFNRKTKIKRLEMSNFHIENLIFKLKIEEACNDTKYRSELMFIREYGPTMFPYKQIKPSPQFDSGIDANNHLPYVVHQGKKLFFPQSYPLELCRKMYKSYIDTECLLGGNYREKSPHQYQKDDFCINDGDILVDVGCAEALLSLDVIEKVSKVYLLETDKDWIHALEETFKSYRNKVVIINKYVSGVDSDSTITLKTVLKDDVGKPLFVKMDIEGAETDVLNGSKEFLKEAYNIKIACCTYHRQDDADTIEKIYNEIGFHYEYSDGYILFSLDPNQKPPYFRHGIIRGWK